MIELPKLIDLPLGYIIFYMQRQLLFLTVPLLIARRSALGWLLGGVGFAGGGCVFHLLISINMQQHVFPLQHATSPFVAAAFQSFHRLMLHLCVVRACPLTRPAPLLAPLRPHASFVCIACIVVARSLLLRAESPIIINFV